MKPIECVSTESTVSAVLGTNENTARGTVGVEGSSDNGFGVYGHSKTGRGVVAVSESDYALRAQSTSSSAVRAESTAGIGVEATSDGSAQGLIGTSKSGDGVWGVAQANGVGVAGVSTTGIGVHGRALGGGIGVLGESELFEGIRGVAVQPGHAAIVANHNGGGIAVYGFSQDGEGMRAETRSLAHPALVALQSNASSQQPAFSATHAGSGLAAEFVGSVRVTGDINMAPADCAEDFDIAAGTCVEPGTVMVLRDESTVQASCHAYDTRVVGVLSGAGTYRPAIVLDRERVEEHRKPVALLGKVFCKVDARFGAIGVGDLLTTSPTPGRAMRADDSRRAFGAVIGKALRRHDAGEGLIPILIALQ